MRQASGYVVAALVSVLVLAACGGEDSVGEPLESAVASFDADGATPDAADGSAGASASVWCELARGVDEASLRFDETDLADPDAVESAVEEMYERMLAASLASPDEIADAVEVSLTAFGRLRDALIAADWEFVSADLSAVDAMAADLQTADDAIDDHTEQICGAFVGDADADEPFDPGAVSIRDQTIGALQGEGFSQSEAECLVDGIDFTDPGAASSVEQIAPVFESCGIELARLDDLGG